MNRDYINNNFLFLLIVLFFSVIAINAQQFKKIEIQARLGDISNNNGIAIADFDLDNDLDIFIVGTDSFDNNNPKTWSRLLKNNNDGSFEDITLEAGFAEGFNHETTFIISNSTGNLITSDVSIFGHKMAASWGDYNNDGFPDIFLSNAVQSQLYRNNGNGTFSNVTGIAGFEETCSDCYITGALWWDYDRDGFLDIYLSDYNYTSDNKLYKNNGNGTFTLISDTNLGGNANSFSAIPIDVNNDGFLDLYVANDYDQDNFLYINQGGNSFVESAKIFGIEDPYDGMGLAISDFDNNGMFELLVTNIKENSFYTNTGINFYVNKANELNISNTDWSWGSVFSDFDLDGYEDFFVTNGFTSNQSDFYFKNISNNNSRTFVEFPLVQAEDIETSIGRSTVSFDYDNDGDLDLVVTDFKSNLFLYENTSIDSNNPNQNNISWAKIKLVGTTSNRDALGSKLKITTDTNLEQYRFLHGSSYLSQSIQSIHFGLDTATTISSLTVTWPNGQEEVFTNLPINKTIEITENNGYTIIDNNTAIKIPGCTNTDSCNYNPNATTDDGSCTFLTSGDIVGKTVSNPLSTEEYQYNNSLGNIYEWEVENGEILSGQGTDAISIRWDVATNGLITCINSNEMCKTEKVSFQVMLVEADDNNGNSTNEQFSVARLWNELLLDAIRNDFARPTVHARNLFHSSIAMYDAWSIYNEEAATYIIGKSINGFSSELDEFISTDDISTSIDKTLSYAVYRLLTHRFKNSPNATTTLAHFDDLMSLLSYDTSLTSIDYSNGDPIALGNFIGETIINYGLQDGSNEINEYRNEFYVPVNDPLDATISGNINITDPNRWQPLSLDVFIDQSGNVLREDTPEFLSPEWGNVSTFALANNTITNYERESNPYKVFLDPGNPPYLDSNNPASSDIYKWGFSLVSVWGSHLSPNDGVMWDISPKSIGNISSSLFPDKFSDYSNFYNLFEGGDIGMGRVQNPQTNLPYEAQLVPRGDYGRVLAEFWADGPDSETPPGHWFVLLNYVSDHPLLVKKLNGIGETLNNLEWDIKAYFILGGAMHDAAVASWSIKGWYDYIRPISSIRYMAEKGQSTDQNLTNYHVDGIPLIDNYIEVVTATDDLSGSNGENIGKIKLYSWKGHDYIDNPETDQAGVDWILAENWWPYQRPSFITPPFAGYVSGHSTFSRAAAEVFTQLTGSEYFPGGIGEFIAKKDEFLVFEEGPSQDVILQWATYRDASDQCSLSRIWGGIHPPMDDIPGRIIGEEIGQNAFQFASDYFLSGNQEIILDNDMIIYPNPISRLNEITITNTTENNTFHLIDLLGKTIPLKQDYISTTNTTKVLIKNLSSGVYILKTNSRSWKVIIH